VAPEGSAGASADTGASTLPVGVVTSGVKGALLLNQVEGFKSRLGDSSDLELVNFFAAIGTVFAFSQIIFRQLVYSLFAFR
jgi:hypothetical protein